jgi:hypothetical protein
MPASSFTPQTPISDVLQRVPESAGLFIREGTDCVGCILVPFCSLQDMSLHYGVDLDGFLRQLEKLRAEK